MASDEREAVSITIEQVPCWIMVKGLGHVVMFVRDPGTYTACGSLLWGYEPPKSSAAKKRVPKRICGKCREALKEINPI